MLATTQMMAAGKMQAGDLLQITQAGLPIWKLLSESLHKPVAEVREMSSQGKLLTADVLPKLFNTLHKNYGGAMAKQARTLTGLWSTFQDNLRFVAMSLIGPFRGALKDGIENLSAFTAEVGKWSDGLGKAMPRLKRLFKAGDVEGFSKALSKALFGSERFAPIFEKMADVGARLGKVYRQSVAPALNDVAGLAGPLVLLLNPLKAADALLGLAADHTKAARVFILGLVAALVVWKTTQIALIAVDKARAAVEWINVVRTRQQTTATLAQRTAMVGLTVVTKAYTIATKLLGLAMRMTPLGMIITGLTAMAGLFVLLWKRSETFRNIVTGAFKKVRGAASAVWSWIKGHWPLLLSILTGPIGAATIFILKHRDKIVGFFKAIPGKLRSAAGAIKDALLAPFTWAFSKIAWAWNNTAGKLSFHVPGWVPGLGGKGFSMPHLPETLPGMAEGGIAVANKPYIVGERGPEIFVPQTTGIVIPNHRIQGGDGAQALTVPGAAQMLSADSSLPDGQPIVLQVVLDRQVIAESTYRHTRKKVARR
jgi:tape measure domain-containing protein